MSLGFGSLIVLALIVGVIVIGAKVRNNSHKLQELEELMSKE
jgi:hypothetical protein